GSGGQGHDPDEAFDEQHAHGDLRGDVALEKIRDDVVADAEGPGLEVAPDADDQAADQGPPHPVDRQALKDVLKLIKEAAGSGGEEAGHQAHEASAQDPEASDLYMGGKRKDRP